MRVRTWKFDNKGEISILNKTFEITCNSFKRTYKFNPNKIKFALLGKHSFDEMVITETVDEGFFLGNYGYSIVIYRNGNFRRIFDYDVESPFYKKIREVSCEKI